MNLSQLYYFSKLSEIQHFSQAARELYITQPTLSHAIKCLEQELGVQLFERDGRRMKLTSFGAEFAEHVKAGLAEIDKGVDLADEYNGKRGGTVNIGAVFTVQTDYLPHMFCEYRAQFGMDAKLNLFQGFSLPLVEGLEEDAYDVVFSAYVPNKPDLVFEHVVSHELVAFAAHDHPLAKRSSVRLEDLRGYDVTTYRRGVPIGEEVHDVLAAADVDASYEYEDEISLGGAVTANPQLVGLATCTLGVQAYPNLAVLRIEDVPRDFHHIYMVYKRDAYRSRAVERFIEFAADYEIPAGVIPSTATSASGADAQ